nr:hypothetical protein [uncultured Vibrio sp.]
MENQHRKIKGYRELNQDEIDLMNKIKEMGEELGKLCNELSAYHVETGSHAIDPRWLNIGKTDLQKGIMALVRSVAMPESF